MQVTKWYVDVVGGNGDVAIAYWLRIGWGPLALTFVSSLLWRDRVLVTRSRFARARPPRVDPDGLSWRTSQFEIEMERRAPAVSTTMLGGTVRWHSELPSTDAVVRIGNAIVSGRGYAEVLEIDGAPWKLPVEELRWGRFTGDQSSVVWIEWRGPHPLTFVACDGITAAEARVSDDSVHFDGRELVLEERRIVRAAPLRESLEEVPLLRRIVPRRFLASEETRWRSRGTLKRAGQAIDHGWCVHEVVRFS